QKVPLDIPPGRNGLQPDVSLQYNSQNTSDSIVGYGWTLSIPYIQRLNKTGSQDLYGNNPYFTSSIDGELALDGTTPVNSSSTPTIADSLPVTTTGFGSGNATDTINYTVPSGSNEVVFVFSGYATVATFNGQQMTLVHNTGASNECNNVF